MCVWFSDRGRALQPHRDRAEDGEGPADRGDGEAGEDRVHQEVARDGGPLAAGQDRGGRGQRTRRRTKSHQQAGGQGE